jgi:hypothetical protein
MTTTFDKAAATAELGEPTGFELERDGARNLGFTGWKIGFGSHGNGSQFEKDWTRGTKVRIYLTTGGRLVTSVSRWSHWQGERSRFASAAHATPEAALAWLVEDAGGELGVASKKSWEAACSKWSALEGADVEQVDEPEPACSAADNPSAADPGRVRQDQADDATIRDGLAFIAPPKVKRCAVETHDGQACGGAIVPDESGHAGRYGHDPARCYSRCERCGAWYRDGEGGAP